MSELNVGNIQGISPTFSVELDKTSALNLQGGLRILGQSYQPLPIAGNLVPNDGEVGFIRWNTTDQKIEVRKETLWTSNSNSGAYNEESLFIGTQGDGGGWTVAEGADDVNHNVYTNPNMKTLANYIRYNDGATGDETRGATSNMRHPLDWVSSTSSADFAFHTGHSNPGSVPWPQLYAIKVTSYRYGKVLNRLRWYKHQNAIGNVNVWGSNQNITRSNFTDTSNWTYLDRLHFGGSGSGSEGGEVSRTFSNANGYRWYMIEMVDINSSALSYPNVGSQGGWAMYGMTMDNT